MRNAYRIIVISVLGTVALTAFFQCSLAQSQPAAEGATISPPLNEVTLKPGEIAEQKIQITNPTGNMIELYPSVMNFQASGEGGEPKFFPASDESSKYSLAHWVSFSQTKLALTPQQVVNFSYTITVPQDAEPGGHYGVVFLATQPPTAGKDVSQVSIASMVGSLVLVRVPGNIVEQGALEEFSAPRFFFKPPVAFTTFIRNQGNIHFKPKGEITIKDWKGQEKERIDFNPLNGNVLPDSRRKFEPKWDAAASPFWKIPIGRFSADLRVAYGQSEQTFGKKIYFWIVPWWFITIVLALLFVIIILIIRRRSRKKKKTATKNNHPPSMSPPHQSGNFQRPPRMHV